MKVYPFCWQVVLTASIFLSLKLSLTMATAEDTAQDGKKAEGSNDKLDGCNFYIAKTSLTDGFGWGVFAGRDFLSSEVVDGNVIEMVATGITKQMNDLSFSRRLWEMDDESCNADNADTIRKFVPGVGSIAQHYPSRKNIEQKIGVDGELLFIAVDNIQKGQEFFVDRGSAAERTRLLLSNSTLLKSKERISPLVPEYYAKADELVKKIVTFGKTKSDALTDAQWIDLLYRIRAEMLAKENKLIEVIPRTKEELKIAAQHGTKVLDQQHRRRERKLMELTNGICLQKIKNDLSSQAGLTATVSENIPKGSVLLSSPVEVLHRNHLKGIKTHVKGSTDEDMFSKFCLGHQESIVSICPITNLVSMKYDDKNANAQIKWGGEKKYLYDFLNEALNDSNLKDATTMDFMLTLDVVALREINEGEEIILEEMNQFSYYTGDDALSDGSMFAVSDELFPISWKEGYRKASSLSLGIVDFGDFQEDTENSHEQKLRSIDCGLYMAPSTIPNAGFGIYTAGAPMRRAEILGSALPVVLHYGEKQSPETLAADQYSYQALNFDAEFESYPRPIALVGTVGSLANSHVALVNSFPHAKFDPILDRCADPGAGASSDLESVFAPVLQLSPGQEVFIDYGISWFSSRDDFDGIPMAEDYNQADTILASLWSFAGMNMVSDNMITDLIGLAKSLVGSHKSRIVMDRVTSVETLSSVISVNGTAKMETEIRSPEWLDANGFCLDHIYMNTSTISQAGKGAFARRPLKKGGVITTSPLIPFFKRHVDGRVRDGPMSLLRNYLIGHPQSSVLFLPTTTMTAINHARGSNKTDGQPNAKIRWSHSKTTSYFIRKPLEDLRKEQHASLMVDIIATKDILPDEEIFIDYGEAWESAWLTHVQQWSSPCKGSFASWLPWGDKFTSSKQVAEMNMHKFDKTHHKWSENHFTTCHYTLKGLEALEVYGTVYDASTQIDRLVSTPTRDIDWQDEGFQLASFSTRRRPCEIVGFDASKGEFDVIVFSLEDRGGIGKVSMVLRRDNSLLAGDLIFAPKPTKSDMQWKGAFRHEIHFPDDVFPDSWKDLA